MKNKIDQMAYECGADAADKNFDYVKILDEHGLQLSDVSAREVKSIFTVAGSTTELKQTSRGCLKVPKANGQISISVPSLNLATSSQHEPNTTQATSIHLSIIPKISMKTICPTAGVYSNTEFASVFNLTTEGNLESVRFEIRAVNDSKNLTKILFRKSLGEDAINLPPHISTAELEEGIYRLESVYYSPSVGWDNIPTNLSEDSRCLLTVIHRKPKLETLSQEVYHAKKDEIIPLKSEGGSGQLYFCLEELSSKIESDSCSPNNMCKNLENFKAAPYLTIDKDGLFQSYTYVRDSANNTSETVCQTISVSSNAPTVKTKWDKESWNISGSMFDEPYSEVSITTQVDHPHIDRATIERSLECKVEFLVHGTDSMSGKNTFCTTGRCAGKPLDEYTPCDSKMTIDLSKAWSKKEVGRSKLKVHVRANDGSGNVSSSMTQIWLNDTRWEVKNITKPFTGALSYSLSNMVAIPSGGILAVYGHDRTNSSYTYISGKWTEVKLPTPDTNIFELYHTQADQIYALMGNLSLNRNPEKTFLARFQGNHWEKVDDVPTQLKVVSGSGRNGVVAFTPEKGIFKISSDRSEVIKLPEDGDFQTCDLTKAMVDAFSSGEIDIISIVCESGEAFVLKEGAWHRIDVGVTPPWTIVTTSFDNSGHLWLQFSDQVTFESGKNGFIDTESLTFSVSPKVDISINAINENGETCFINKTYNFKTNSWDICFKRNYIFAGLNGIEVGSRSRTFLAYTKDGIFIRKKDAFTFVPVNLEETTITNKASDTVEGVEYWALLDANNDRQLYSYRKNKVSDFGPEYSGIEKNSNLMNAAGKLQSSTFEGIFSEMKDGVWQTMFKDVAFTPKPQLNLMISSELSAYIFDYLGSTLNFIQSGTEVPVLQSRTIENEYFQGNKHSDSNGNIFIVSLPVRDMSPGDILRINKLDTKKFTLTDNSSDVFFSEKSIFLMRGEKLFSKSTSFDDDFIETNPDEHGLSFLSTGASIRFAKNINEYLVWFRINPADPDQIQENKIWNSRTNTFLPFKSIITNDDGFLIDFKTIKLSPSGQLFAANGRSIFKLTNDNKWEEILSIMDMIPYSVRREQGMFGKMTNKIAAPSNFYFDESGNIIIDNGNSRYVRFNPKEGWPSLPEGKFLNPNFEITD